MAPGGFWSSQVSCSLILKTRSTVPVPLIPLDFGRICLANQPKGVTGQPNNGKVTRENDSKNFMRRGNCFFVSKNHRLVMLDYGWIAQTRPNFPNSSAILSASLLSNDNFRSKSLSLFRTREIPSLTSCKGSPEICFTFFNTAKLSPESNSFITTENRPSVFPFLLPPSFLLCLFPARCALYCSAPFMSLSHTSQWRISATFAGCGLSRGGRGDCSGEFPERAESTILTAGS